MSADPPGEEPGRPAPLPRVLRAPAPLFLERETYRRRRLMDAARLLPLFGFALLLVPVFWTDSHGTASAGIYLFLVWLAVIVATGLLARKLSEPLRRGAPPAGPDPAAPPPAPEG